MVGHILIHLSHDPQWFFSGLSYSKILFTKITPKNNQEPNSLDTKLVCLPCHPMPDFSANGFSIKGAVSTKTLTFVSFFLSNLAINLLENDFNLPFIIS